MKILTIIARLLLGLMFTVFGANFFLNFIPMPRAAEIDVDECAVPNVSYSLSSRRGKPATPPFWRSVRMRGIQGNRLSIEQHDLFQAFVRST